jgi:AcrR family transcriptional regulator
MNQKTDLRIIKTRRSIKEAFMELIMMKPVNKITVTELAERAEISKGTFYLHYLDIYDLYNRLVEEVANKIAESFNPYPDLFTAPETFVRTFMFAQNSQFTVSLTPAQRKILSEKNIKFSDNYPSCFIDAFKTQIYKVGKLVPCLENDMKIEFLITGMLSIIIKYPMLSHDIKQKELMIQYMTTIVKETFPEFYA